MVIRRIISGVFILVGFVPPAFAGDSFFYKEINLIGGYSGRDHWAGKSGELVNSAGFEYYRKFANDYGDYLTADLQVRLAYDSMESSHDAWGLQIHNAWLLYKLGSAGKLRVGHFDSAFGLEPQLDTHATILQTLTPKNIGFKKDWGIGFEGMLGRFDYKTALQLGSGMSIRRQDDSFLITGRIGTPTTQNFQYGVSLLYGKVLEPMGMNTWPRGELISERSVLKKRIGFDSQYLFGAYLFKGEIAYGRDDRKAVLGYLGEIDYTLPQYQNITLELQFQSWIHDVDKSSMDDSTATIAAAYTLNSRTTLRAAFSRDVHMMDEKEETKFVVQVYFFTV